MVLLTSVCRSVTDTFGFRVKGTMFNHRKPIKFHKFKQNLDPEKIVEHYSRDDLSELDPRKNNRTHADAMRSLGKINTLLPNLSPADLEASQKFQNELERQRSLIARIDKIQVLVDTKPYIDKSIMMNKYLSTPYDCARHLHEFLSKRTVVAEVTKLNDEQSPSIYWDMHRPLVYDCKIKMRHFVEENLNEVNKAYWRSCSFVLGMAIRLAFKDGVKLLLHSWPKPDVESGSFVYDVALNLQEIWKPSEAELRCFTKILWDISKASLPFERLSVDAELAKQMFSTNPFKLASIDSIVKESPDEKKVTVYRCGGFLELSCGPMISNTNQIGRISLASVHNLANSKKNSDDNIFYRFQGVSLPSQLPISSYVFQNLLFNRAKELNKSQL